MQTVMRSLVLCFFLASGLEVTPVQKVITLLENMRTKGQREMQGEQETFAKFTQFCKDMKTEKGFAIKDSNAAIEKNAAAMAKNNDIARSSGKKIKQLQGSIQQAETEMAGNADVRATEKKDFEAALADYDETLLAIAKATTILKRQNYDRPQAEALLQRLAVMNRIPVDSSDALMNYFAGKVERKPKGSFLDKALQQPDVDAYQGHGSAIIDLLADMESKTAASKSKLETEEANKAHAFNMLKSDLTSQRNYDSKNEGLKQVERTSALETAATAEGNLNDAMAAKAADQKYVKDLTATCSMKSQEFADRQSLRKEELVAIGKAVEVISDASLAGAADKHLPSFIQVESDSKRKQALSFLNTASKTLQSRALALVAASAAADPFKKVKGMIATMIENLEKEAADEADHKAYCNKELKANRITRETKSGEQEALMARVAKLTAQINANASEMANLTKQMGELQKAMTEATAIRNEEKAKNTDTVADAKAAQEATQKAIGILQSFYAKAAKASSLLQSSQAPPGTWDSSYKGQQDGNNGVVSMLQVIQSDFARLEAETSAAETQAQQEYDELMTDSTTSKKEKYDQHLKLKRQNMDLEFQNNNTKKDLRATNTALSAATEYYEALKAECTASGLSYEERKAKREEEIKALEEALTFFQ